MSETKKIYLASDFHLGTPNYEASLKREKAVVQWLETVRHDAAEIYLVGDIFDFWFEYKSVVPKGFIRLLGKLAEITDSGIPVHVFTGNHDMWMFGYLTHEVGVIMHREPVVINHCGKAYYIGHGDGLGPGDHGYKFIKKVFANPVCQWLFARIHPNAGIAVANFWSRRSRQSGQEKDKIFLGKEKEWLYAYCLETLKSSPGISCFIFGHRHLPLNLEINAQCRYINLGDWITHFTYARIDSTGIELLNYEPIFSAKSTSRLE